MGAYQREAAVAYARQWALRRNPQYLNFDRMGGDCTNFVSQCLHAGGMEMNFTPQIGWYYRSAYDRTPSWTGVAFLYDFLMGRNKIGPRASIVGRENLEIGDIVQLGRADGTYYHSLLVVSTAPDGPYVAAHSSDCFLCPLSGYAYERARFLHVDAFP